MIFILEWLFLGKEGPQREDRADANDDGVLDISDPVRILTMLFSGTGPLPAPYPQAGWDLSADELKC